MLKITFDTLTYEQWQLIFIHVSEFSVVLAFAGQLLHLFIKPYGECTICFLQYSFKIPLKAELAKQTQASGKIFSTQLQSPTVNSMGEHSKLW